MASKATYEAKMRQWDEERRRENQYYIDLYNSGRTASGRSLEDTLAMPKTASKSYDTYLGLQRDIMTGGKSDLDYAQKARREAFYARNYIRNNTDAYDAEHGAGSSQAMLDYLENSLGEMNNTLSMRHSAQMQADQKENQRIYQLRNSRKQATEVPKAEEDDPIATQMALNRLLGLEEEPGEQGQNAEPKTTGSTPLAEKAPPAQKESLFPTLAQLADQMPDVQAKSREEIRREAAARGVSEEEYLRQLMVEGGKDVTAPGATQLQADTRAPQPAAPVQPKAAPESAAAVQTVTPAQPSTAPEMKSYQEIEKEAFAQGLTVEAYIQKLKKEQTAAPGATQLQADTRTPEQQAQDEEAAAQAMRETHRANMTLDERARDSLNTINTTLRGAVNEEGVGNALIGAWDVISSAPGEMAKSAYDMTFGTLTGTSVDKMLEESKGKSGVGILATLGTSVTMAGGNFNDFLLGVGENYTEFSKNVANALGMETSDWNPARDLRAKNAAAMGRVVAPMLENGTAFENIAMNALSTSINSMAMMTMGAGIATKVPGAMGGGAGSVNPVLRMNHVQNITSMAQMAPFALQSATEAYDDAEANGLNGWQAAASAIGSGLMSLATNSTAYEDYCERMGLGVRTNDILMANMAGTRMTSLSTAAYEWFRDAMGTMALNEGMQEVSESFAKKLNADMWNGTFFDETGWQDWTEEAKQEFYYGYLSGALFYVTALPSYAPSVGALQQMVDGEIETNSENLSNLIVQVQKDMQDPAMRGEAENAMKQLNVAEQVAQKVLDGMPLEQARSEAAQEQAGQDAAPVDLLRQAADEAAGVETGSAAGADQAGKQVAADTTVAQRQSTQPSNQTFQLERTAKTLDPKTAEAYRNNYDGRPVSEYYTSFMSIYGAAKKGMSLQEATAQAKTPVNPAAAMAAHNAGTRAVDGAKAQKQNQAPTAQAVAAKAAVEPQTETPAKSAGGQASPSATLADTLLTKYIGKGTAFNSAVLFEAADKAFGGTQAAGTYSSKDAYDAMEMAVNKRLLAMATDMNGDAKTAKRALNRLENLLTKLPTQTKRSAEQEQYQQFSTPPNIAYLAAWLGNVNKNDTVLEPSAGVGGIATFAKAFGANVVVNELSERRLGLLKEMGFDQVYGENAEQLNNTLPDSVQPTVVLMNPPFSAAAGRMSKNSTQNATRHVEQALLRLQDGGRLVAVLGKGMADDASAFQDWFKKIRQQYDIRANIQVDGSNYKKYGTTWGVQLMVVDKTGPQKGQTVTGVYKDLKEIPAALEGVRNERSAASTSSKTEPNAIVAGGEKAAVRQMGQRETVSGAVGGTDVRLRGRDNGGNIGRTGLPVSASDQTGGRPDAVLPTDGGSVHTGGASGTVDAGHGFAEPQGGRRERGESDNRVSGNSRAESPEQSRRDGRPGRTRLTTKPKSDNGVYAEYVPGELPIKGAKKHPAPLVESAAMAAVQMPTATYKPNLPAELITSGGLSAAQLENVVYAGQAHGQTLPNGARKGYFIGDGTGVGKGRQIAAIILDNMRQGRKKAIWVSKNMDLLSDAQRDWADIGGDKREIQKQGAFRPGKPITMPEGILFTGYDTLGKGLDTDQSRVRQIVDWLGEDFDGVIAFDEAHNMNNVLGKTGSRGKTKGAKKALAGVDLQKLLPNARVVYVSATGATDVNEMAYAERLGLWGKGTAFNTVNDFIEQIGSSGLSAMELVARDMKAMGVYLARSISYDGVTYDTLQHTLDPMQTQIYDTMSEAWQTTLQNINAALEVTNANLNPDERSAVKSQYYGAMQRFYNQVLTSMGMPSVIADIRQELNAGNSIVLQIVNTLEAETNRQLAKAKKTGTDLDELDLTPRGTLLEYLQNSFPIQAFEEYEDEKGNARSRPVTNAKGEPVIDKQAVAIRDALVAQINEMSVPDGPLDMLFDAFGAEAVAEVTGRSRRVVPKKNAQGETARVEESRSSRHAMADVEAFQNGDKRILVFSDAGGTGKSYHADLRAKNQQQRVHYLIQPGWSASKATQGFGRTHRSNQAQTPKFKLVTTNAMGQKRFVSTIARRLDQLGALTKGQRETGSGMFGGKDNLESSLAKDSLRAFYEQLGLGRIEGLDGKTILKKLGLFDKFSDQYGRFRLNDVEARNINTFLNRILALGIEEQNRVFGAFYDIFESAYDTALQNGTLDMGMETVKADKVEIVDDQVIRTDAETGATTNYVQAKTYRKPVMIKTVANLEAMRQHFEGLYQTTDGEIRGVFRVADKTASDGKIHKMYRVQSPTASKLGTWSDTTLAERTKPLPRKEWSAAWAQEVAKQAEYEESTTHMLTGSLLPIWNMLPKEGNTRAMRIMADDGNQYLGRVISPTQIDSVLGRLGAAARTKEQYTPADLMQKVLAGNHVRLMENHMGLKRSRVSGEYRIEVTGQNLWYLPQQYRGIIQEKIGYQNRYFIPTGENGAAIMAELIKNNPVAEVATGADVEYRRVAKRGKHWNALDGYTDHEVENWRQNKRIQIAKNEESVTHFVNEALADKNHNKKLYLGKVDTELGGLIQQATGLDLVGYNCTLRGDEIRKIMKDHGSPTTEEPRGQRAFTPEDFLQIPEIITNPDNITRSQKDFEGKPALLFRKNIDGRFTVVAYVAARHLDLTVQSAYIGKNKGSLATTPRGSSFEPVAQTSETLSGTAPNQSISRKGQNSQEYRHAETVADDWTTTRAGNPDRAKIGITDIIGKIRHTWGLPITTGHVRGAGVTGQYNTQTKGIRTRIANNLPTVSHELGHHLNREYGLVAGMNAETRQELAAALPADVREMYKDNKTQMLSEGFAEYLRRYLKNRETEAIDSPKVTEYLRSSLEAGDMQTLDNLADDVNAYYSLTAGDAQTEIRLRGEKAKDYRRLKEKLGNFYDRVYLLWVDANHGIRKFDRETGGDVYQLATNSAYADAVAGQVLTGDLTDRNGQYVADGLQKALKGVDLGNDAEYKAFGEYLVVRHGPERLREGMRVFASDLKNSSVWMERRQAQLEASYPAFKEAAEKLYAFQTAFLQTWGVDTGLVSKEAAKKWAKRWECYVPFNRAMDDGSEGIGAKRGFANQNSTIRKARGSGRDLMHPVDNIITNVTKMVNAAQRNQVMVAAVQAAANVPDTARFMEAIPTPMRQKTANLQDTKKQLIGSVLEADIDPASTEAVLGLIEGLDNILIQYTQGKPHGDVVAVLMGGQPEFYKINDPLLLKSLANMAPRQANAILDAYGRVTRFITGNITGRNVVWSLMSNAPRDLMTLFTYSKDKNPAHLFGGIASAYVNKVKGQNADPLYKEYLAMGGGKTSAYTADKNLQANVRQKLAGKSQWWNPLEWMDFISDTVESGPRYATYKVLREKKGMSPREAFYESADVTTNFRRGGTLSRDLNKIIPFFNAGMQGVDKFARWITAEDAKPGARKKAAATRMSQYVLASTVMALLMHGLNSGDDEKKKEYAQLSGYTKNSYWTIPLGDGKYFTIPKPREIAVLSSFIQASLDRYANENKGAFDDFYEYATNAFLPNVASDLAQMDMFGALGNLGFFGTAFHMGANKDFMGRPIVSKSLEELERKDQFTQRTSKAAKALGEALGESPQMIDYFFQNTLGGFWKWQAALFPVGDEYTDYTLGVKSSYVRDNLYSTDVINHLYDQRDAAKKTKNSHPDSIEAESRYKWLNNMAELYGKYQKLSKGEPETDTNRGVRQTVLDMAAGINNYARFGDMTPEMKALDAFAEVSKTTEFYPAVMSETVKDGHGMLHALTAEQYVDYQTDYLSRYWDYVPGTLADPATASVDGLNTAKEQAKMEATARILMVMGAEGKETEKVRGMVAGGIDSKTSIRFGTAIDGAYADGSLTKDEVLAILDGMDITDPQRAYLYSTRYSGVTGNVYASVEDINAYLLTANPDSGKQSLTNTYKPLVIARYMAGDDAGVEELLMKLEALEVYDAKWKPYYTRERVYGWIDEYLKQAQ